MELPFAEIQYVPCEEGVRIGSHHPSEEFKENIFQFAQQQLGQEAWIIEDCSFVVWTSSALGAGEAGKPFLCVMTPGYRVLLRAGEKRAILHTDAEGQRIVIRAYH